MKKWYAGPRTPMGKAAQALLDKRRWEVVTMLEGCGIDAKDIPIDTDIRREGSRVWMERFVRDPRTGRVLFSRETLSDRLEEFSIEPKVIPSWIPSA